MPTINGLLLNTPVTSSNSNIKILITATEVMSFGKVVRMAMAGASKMPEKAQTWVDIASSHIKDPI